MVPTSIEHTAPEGLGRDLVRLQPRLRAHARRRVGADAEDLVQETLLRALQHAGTFQAGRAAWPWLRTIADRVAHRWLERDARLIEQDGGPEAAAPPVDALENRDEVEALLARLAPAEREVVVAHYLNGRPVAGIALDQSAPVGTVKAQLHRARRRLLVIAAGLSAGLVCAALVGRWLHARQADKGRPQTAQRPARGVVHHAAATIEHVPVAAPAFTVVDHRKPPMAAPRWSVEGGQFLALGSSEPRRPAPPRPEPPKPR